MKFKFKSALVALALLAVGSANAITITGTINSLRVTTSDSNNSVWMNLNDSTANCNNNGPVAILRSIPEMTDKTYANMYSIILAAKLSNKSITAIVDNNCSVLQINLDN